MNKALFLDRDGVINLDTGYPSAREEIVFLEHIFSLCRAAKEQGYLLLVVTNQAGIARGYYTEEDFEALMQWMQEQFTAQGCALDGWYYCPHHPEFGVGEYRTACECRKPKPGMLLTAAKEWDIDMRRSILIGDKASDINAANAAGVGNAWQVTQPGKLREVMQQFSELSEVAL
ncbi:MAG: HAD family hydrolase [Alphaproteobacteria bacterium]|nr:HAD family hydrolase [Alphaproteobacteria bacterium]